MKTIYAFIAIALLSKMLFDNSQSSLAQNEIEDQNPTQQVLILK